MVGEHSISIWFFIGALLSAYGALILGVGVYEFSAPDPNVVLSSLHMPVWFGIVMLALGLVYLKKFWPKRP
ncbi:MAG: hypothetical protein ACM336_16905 [Acidobacteriota bacterium]